MILAAMGLVVVVVIVLMLALPYFISTDSIRIRLAQDLSNWTGYNVQLHEPPHLSFFPRFQASLKGVVLTPNTANASPLMEAERIDVHLSLMRAIFGLGEISFSETHIIRPHFIMDEPLKNTADFLSALSRSTGAFGQAVSHAREVVQQNPEQPDLTRLLAQPFGRIVVEDGWLTYRNQDDGGEQEISNIGAEIDWPESTRAASFRLTGRWRGALTEVRVDAEQALLLLAGGRSTLKASVNSPKGGATLTGTARVSDSIVFDGRLALRSPGWDQTMDWLGYRQVFGVALKAPVVWESGFNLLPERLQMNDVQFKLGHDNARGAVEINRQDGRWITTGSLAFQTLDMNRLVGVFFPAEDRQERLDLTLLDQLGLDLRLSSPEAKLGDINLSNLAASIQIRNGQGIFDIGNAMVFGGTLQSNMQLKHDNGQSRIEGRISASHVDMEALQTAFGWAPLLHGSSNFILTMNAPFVRWSDVAREMIGNLTLTGNGGTISGYAIKNLMTKLPASGQMVIPQESGSQFGFGRFSVEAGLHDGQANITKASVQLEGKKLLLAGLLPYGSSDDLMTLHRAAALNMQLVPDHYSATSCPTVDCLMASLSHPPRYFLTGSLQEPVLLISPQ